MARKRRGRPGLKPRPAPCAKFGYDNLEEAEVEADRQSWAAGRTMVTYRCPSCSRYHLTRDRRY